MILIIIIMMMMMMMMIIIVGVTDFVSEIKRVENYPCFENNWHK